MQSSTAIYNVAIYCRLSRDDGLDAESSSIQSQKEFITEYVNKHNWNIIDYYCDDGYSGTNFTRPAFQKLIRDIEAKKVNCVITKDLSRLGRNYVYTGYYTEEFFPNNNIRYIAINDNYDTLSEMDNDFAPFKNIINEWYAKDISKKVKSTFSVKRNNGEMVSGQPLYGYYYPKGTTKREIAEEEASVVRLIFDLYIKGDGVSKIKRYLEEHKIYSPKYSLYLRYHWFSEYFIDKPEDHKYHWTETMIRNIIKNEEYTGKIIVNKTKKPSFKIKKRVKTPEEQLIVKDGPAIITKEVYDSAQAIFQKNKNLRTNTETDHLKGIVYCPKCGKKMIFSNRKIVSPRSKKCLSTYLAYICRNTECHQNATKQSVLNQIIEHELLLFKKAILNNQEEFFELCKEKFEAAKAETTNEDTVILNKIKETKTLASNIDKKIEYLISGRADGTIPVSTYQQLLKKYNVQKVQYEKDIETLKKELLPKENNDEFDYINFCKDIIDKLLSVGDESLLESGMVHNIINKIEPHVVRKYVAEENKVRNVVESVNITYYKIDNIIKELMSDENSDIH